MTTLSPRASYQKLSSLSFNTKRRPVADGAKNRILCQIQEQSARAREATTDAAYQLRINTIKKLVKLL